MPGRDGSGPAGDGPRTGGQRGNCPPATTAKPKRRPRDGRGQGAGAGRGKKR